MPTFTRAGTLAAALLIPGFATAQQPENGQPPQQPRERLQQLQQRAEQQLRNQVDQQLQPQQPGQQPEQPGQQPMQQADQRSMQSSMTSSSSNVISSHQIDRYAAIQQLRSALTQDPNNLADWILLGELSQEVATEVPADTAKGYYRLASESYANAVKLAPDNSSLQAAASFAAEQERDADSFDQNRRSLTTPYLEARRRELEGSNMTPTLRVYNSPNSGTTTASNLAIDPNSGQVDPDGVVPGTPNTPSRELPYGSPYYRSYVDSQGRPYTYQDYANSYGYGQGTTNANPGQAPGQVAGQGQGQAQTQQPMTMRQYMQQFPQVLGNEALQRLDSALGTPATTPGAGVPATTPTPGAGVPRP